MHTEQQARSLSVTCVIFPLCILLPNEGDPKHVAQ